MHYLDFEISVKNTNSRTDSLINLILMIKIYFFNKKLFLCLAKVLNFRKIFSDHTLITSNFI